MTFGGLIGRIAFQLVFCAIAAVVAFGSFGWIYMLVFSLPLIGISVFILAPTEYLLAHVNMRWVAWFAIPLLGVAWPFLPMLLERNSNFPPGTPILALELGCVGVSWSLASVIALWFRQPLMPDERYFG